MKAIIYTGFGLISIAAVYGMADYYGSSNNGSLKQLYHENEKVLPETPVQQLDAQHVAQLTIREEESMETIPLSTTGIDTKKTVKKKRPSFRLEDFSRKALPVEIDPIVEEPQPVTTAQETTPALTEKEPDVTTVAKPAEKKIDLRMFSRAKPVARKVTNQASKKE